MNTNINHNTSFGSTFSIASDNAQKLRSHSTKVIDGIYNAAKKMQNNGKNDELASIITSSKKEDFLSLGYFNENQQYQSSFFLSLKKLGKLSSQKIENIILDSYNNLTKNNKFIDNDSAIITRSKNNSKIKNVFDNLTYKFSKKEKLEKLINEFGADDSVYY